MSDFRVAVRRTNEWDGPSMLKIYTPYELTLLSWYNDTCKLTRSEEVLQTRFTLIFYGTVYLKLTF